MECKAATCDVTSHLATSGKPCFFFLYFSVLFLTFLQKSRKRNPLYSYPLYFLNYLLPCPCTRTCRVAVPLSGARSMPRRPSQRHAPRRRCPNVIREWASVDECVRDTHSFQLVLNARLLTEHPLSLAFCHPTELRRNEQLDACFLGRPPRSSLEHQGPLPKLY